jgi:hypothetical protein
MATIFFRVDYSSGLTGFALFALAENEIRGADVGGLSYRGTYIEANGKFNAKILARIPAGVKLVTGVCLQAMDFSFDIVFDASRVTRQNLDLPIGKVHLSILPLV